MMKKIWIKETDIADRDGESTLMKTGELFDNRSVYFIRPLKFFGSSTTKKIRSNAGVGYHMNGQPCAAIPPFPSNNR